MDWQIPTLRIKHLEKVLEKTGIDLADFEQLVDLENERRLADVVKCLSPAWDEEEFFGEQITEAQTQLFGSLEVFFPPDKAAMINGLIPAQTIVRKELTAELREKSSGKGSTRLAAS